MAALSGWLQQIVAVVLLASLVDLLLPNRTMQRYVRLVAGLLVLMTVSTPLLHWFKQDFVGELSAELDAVQRPSSDAADLDRIREQAAKLSASRDRQAAQLAQTELAAQIEAAVDQSGAGEVRKVDVRMDDAAGAGGQVAAVTIWLAGSADGGTGGSDTAGADGTLDVAGEIEPVAPVIIDIDPDADAAAAPNGGANAGGGSGAPDGAAAGGTAGGADSGGAANGSDGVPGDDSVPVGALPADEQTRSKVTALVAARFGVATDRIRVVREADGAAAN